MAVVIDSVVHPGHSESSGVPVGRVFLGPDAGQNHVIALLSDILVELRGIREAMTSDGALRMSPEARLAVMAALAEIASRG